MGATIKNPVPDLCMGALTLSPLAS